MRYIACWKCNQEGLTPNACRCDEAGTLNNRCTLTDELLIAKSKQLIDELCRTGGRSWTMRVPVDFDKDHDMILSELVERFEACVKGGC